MPGKERQVSNRDRILVVDEASDTAEVLQAVLEARGVSVQRVRRLDPSAATADERCPAVVVLNAESMDGTSPARSEEHTSELQSLRHLVCRLLLENATSPPEISTLSLHDALPI